jgi:hypothetical protein
MTKFDHIYNSLKSQEGAFYTMKNLTDDIFEFNILNGSQKHAKKYIIFERLDIYRNLDDLLKFLEIISGPIFRDVDSENILRIPFFAGCSGFDLAQLLMPNTQISLDIKLDQKISFERMPSDFNTEGSKRFCNYLNLIKNTEPIYRSNNNYSDYKQYFNNIVSKNSWKVNLILPYAFLYLPCNKEAVIDIYKEIEEAQAESTGKHPQLIPTHLI